MKQPKNNNPKKSLLLQLRETERNTEEGGMTQQINCDTATTKSTIST